MEELLQNNKTVSDNILAWEKICKVIRRAQFVKTWRGRLMTAKEILNHSPSVIAGWYCDADHKKRPKKRRRK